MSDAQRGQALAGRRHPQRGPRRSRTPARRHRRCVHRELPARHGLAYADIRTAKPDIVYCSLSGYGQQGSWAGRGAHDHVVRALTCMMMIMMSNDSEDAPPTKVGFPLVDVDVGMLGALSV